MEGEGRDREGGLGRRKDRDGRRVRHWERER